MKKKYIAWFKDIGKEDVGIVGGKGANLGEMTGAGIPVPYGFVVTSNAYFDFLKDTGLDMIITERLKGLDIKDTRMLQEVSANIRKDILKYPIPEHIASEIMIAYMKISEESLKSSTIREKLSSLISHPYVAVRSSATAEDLPGASFAGQQETYLNVSGEANLIKKVHEAWASLFTARAVFYREEQKFDHMKVGIAVVVQIMVNSEKSGIMFTLDPVTNNKNIIMIEAIFGLGEFIVQGEVTPDHYEVDKKTMAIVSKKTAVQTKKMVRAKVDNRTDKISEKEGSVQKLTDKEIMAVAEMGVKLEKHYYFPQDVEWAMEKGKVYIVQTRPVTTIKTKSEDKNIRDASKQIADANMQVIVKGDPASPGIAWGPAKVIYSAKEIDKVEKGDVLVTVQTNPDFVPAMKKAVAIVTERGGRTSHAAIVSRELGIPAVVGTVNATKKIANHSVITVNGMKGEVYSGALDKHQQEELSKLSARKKSPAHKTATKIYVNLATPERVVEVSGMNADGIGLLRAEFMIADIGTHPKKLIKEHKEALFIEKLSDDLLKFAKAFNPRPVVYRATDFKTNEYRNLIGGQEFEPEEPNPMLGYRGAYRYMSDPKVFELELEAIKRVRNKLGYKNLWLMLPFVRTVRELVEVKKIIAGSGLSRSSNFKLWMMVEIPSNVILLDKFCEAGIDGVSIGSNDLTMLILGTDRDNTEVSPEFDERNDAVTWAIEKVVKTCHKYGITSSICGQAPSDYPELVEKLVKWGITSMSVNPDALDAVRETVYNAESKLVNKK